MLGSQYLHCNASLSGSGSNLPHMALRRRNSEPDIADRFICVTFACPQAHS